MGLARREGKPGETHGAATEAKLRDSEPSSGARAPPLPAPDSAPSRSLAVRLRLRKCHRESSASKRSRAALGRLGLPGDGGCPRRDGRLARPSARVSPRKPFWGRGADRRLFRLRGNGRRRPAPGDGGFRPQERAGPGCEGLFLLSSGSPRREDAVTGPWGELCLCGPPHSCGAVWSPHREVGGGPRRARPPRSGRGALCEGGGRGRNPVSSLALKDAGPTCWSRGSCPGSCRECGKRPAPWSVAAEGLGPQVGLCQSGPFRASEGADGACPELVCFSGCEFEPGKKFINFKYFKLSTEILKPLNCSLGRVFLFLFFVLNTTNSELAEFKQICILGPCDLVLQYLRPDSIRVSFCCLICVVHRGQLSFLSVHRVEDALLSPEGIGWRGAGTQRSISPRLTPQ